MNREEAELVNHCPICGSELIKPEAEYKYCGANGQKFDLHMFTFESHYTIYTKSLVEDLVMVNFEVAIYHKFKYTEFYKKEKQLQMFKSILTYDQIREFDKVWVLA